MIDEISRSKWNGSDDGISSTGDWLWVALFRNAPCMRVCVYRSSAQHYWICTVHALSVCQSYSLYFHYDMKIWKVLNSEIHVISSCILLISYINPYCMWLFDEQEWVAVCVLCLRLYDSARYMSSVIFICVAYRKAYTICVCLYPWVFFFLPSFSLCFARFYSMHTLKMPNIQNFDWKCDVNCRMCGTFVL